MLMITLAISGTAYLFINAAFTQQTQGLDLVDAFCQESASDTVNIILRNIGTSAVSTSSVTISQTSPAGSVSPVWVGGVTSINPGTTATVTDVCESSGARSCIYRILPPSGRTLTATVTCA